jgi:hypothetical protein
MEPLFAVRLVGSGGWESAGIGHYLPFLAWVGSAGAVGSFGVAVGAAGALAGRWLRSARRMMAQAREVGWRAWLSLYNSTTTLAPRVTYSSSRRTHL